MFRQFTENQMKTNADKYHLILNCSDQKEIKIDSETSKSSNCQKLLGIRADEKLNFNSCVKGLCKRTSQKSHVIARVTPHMSVAKTRMLIH